MIEIIVYNKGSFITWQSKLQVQDANPGKEGGLTLSSNGWFPIDKVTNQSD